MLFRSPGLADQSSKSPLQPGAAEDRFAELVKGRSKPGDSPLPSPPAKQRVDPVEVEMPQSLCAGEESTWIHGPPRSCHLEERQGQGANRHPIDPTAVDWAQIGGAADLNAASRTPGADSDHLIRNPQLSHQPPEPRSRSVAEQRAVPTRENRREAAPMVRKTRMPDGVDPLMNSVEPASGRFPRDPLSGEPEPAQLPRRDQPVLPGGQFGNVPPSLLFVLHTDIKSMLDQARPRGTSVRLRRIAVSGCL